MSSHDVTSTQHNRALSQIQSSHLHKDDSGVNIRLEKVKSQAAFGVVGPKQLQSSSIHITTKREKNRKKIIDVKKRMSVKGPGFIPSQVGLILPSDSYSDAFVPSAYGSSRQAYLAKERLIAAQRSVRASSTSMMNQ